MEVNKIQLNIIKNSEAGENIGGVSSGEAGGVFVFYINSAEYTAESGMTWEQWINSSYDSGGFYVNNGNIMLDTGFGGFIQYIENVKASDVINVGGEYWTADL